MRTAGKRRETCNLKYEWLSGVPRSVGIALRRPEITCTSQAGRQQPGCTRHSQRSYSSYDTQECSIAGADRDDSGNRSFSLDIRLNRPKCPTGIGSSANAVPVVCLCICLFQFGGVLLRVPEGTVVTLARAALFQSSPQESRGCLARYQIAINRSTRRFGLLRCPSGFHIAIAFAFPSISASA